MSAANTSFVPRPLPLRLPRVCVPVAGASAAEMVEKAEAMVRDNSFLEFRLDYLKSPGLALPHIRRFLSYHPEAVAIGTCRRAVNGGKFRGSLAAEVDVLTKAAANGCQLIDLELQSASAMKPAELERLRGRASLILSFHDFHATKKIEATFAKMQQFSADYYKIVTTATNLADNVAMMKFLEQTRNTHSVIGVCMGEQGLISRILSLRAGSLWTFAAASPGEETAPGMITAKMLQDVYRIEQVDTATRIYGVAGDPVSHSLSPQMMNAAFRRENVNAVYLALHAKAVSDLLKCVQEIPIHGLSITMPYKEEIVRHLDNSDTLTQKTGACNTLVRAQDGKLYGFNTDVTGIVQPLEQRMSLAGAKVLVLGAGGAARAAVFGVKARGAEVYILNRSSAPAQKLARQAKAKVLKRSDLKKFSFDVIINATPVGMSDPKASPLNEKESKAKFVLDMVYTDAETRFARLARAQGATVIPGSEMFVYQGARQFEIWTGKPAPLPEMQNEVLAAIATRARNGNNHKKR